ncbi:MAG: UDP-N-acetylglucosamine diphosphorylase/glucosamine-1-phosphate N-acetyltransferase [Chloroflexi bacterium]|nr:MAG: UDP-N-acetylglucosamine diphosphorylase/glucosamine-1-phosphate N-acetyltransferase [Chloroflexota bacterium]RLT29949.1 MAG: UDP-N-acetylglucosamine diphosphorylase/glucosamine-1-phosphate N-acetyltransferase [Chloroflexota bacterium]
MTPSSRRPEQHSGTTPIILAAGVGSRMGSATPKVLHPILGRPLALWAVEAARAAFGGTPLVVLSPATAGLASQLGAVTVAQQPKPLGTGDAVRCALPSLPADADEVLIACGDTPLLTSELLVALAEQRRASGVPLAIAAFRAPDPTGYGRVILNDAECATAVIEERDADEETREIDLVNAGVYVADRAWLERAVAALTPSKSGEIYLTDLVAAAAAAGSPAPIVVGDAAELEGVNDRSQFADAAAALRERINHVHMLNGVAIIDPTTAWIDGGVTIAADAVIEPNTRISGSSTIGAGSTIGTGSSIESSNIGAGCTVRSSAIESSTLADGVDVGPFAHIRPGCTIGAKAHVGNFAELKATTLGEGAKVGHHSYLGDTSVGEGANIGAGTITANYDGTAKHRTEIGARAFTGVGTLLVAPVRLGVGAKTGAGSVVTRDVPDGTLVFGVPAKPQE